MQIGINKKIFNFTFLSLIVLFLQNLIIFWGHYFQGYIFSGDFERGYFSLPAFFTTAINSGVFPQWDPFQNMGYPFSLFPQTGLYYPFFWIYPIFNIPYTLDAAVAFHGIHIFLGSVGMFFLLKYLFKSSKYALVGAFAFTFFGGFYTSSAFADVTRAFAIVPWMFYVFTLNFQNPTIRKATLFIPIVIFLLVTGGYPGIFIAGIFIMGLFVILQAINSHFRGLKKVISIRNAGIMFTLIFLGLAISTIHLGHFIEHDDKLLRLADTSLISYSTLTLETLPSMFMPTEGLWYASVWIISTFVTLPILVLASFFPLSSFKKFWVFGVLLLIGFLMAMGNKFIFWEIMSSIFAPLAYSRIPISDYKIFIVIPIIILSIEGLRRIVERQITWKKFAYRTLFVLFWFTFVISFIYFFPDDSIVSSSILNHQIIFSILILGSIFFILVFYIKTGTTTNPFLKNKVAKFSLIPIILLIVIISVDGYRVISDLTYEEILSTWRVERQLSVYTVAEYPLEKNNKLITYSIFENLPKQRPEREIMPSPASWLSWKGNLDGSYMMQSYGSGTYFVSVDKVLKNPLYRDYMLKKWTPILLDSNYSNSSKITLSESVFSNIDSTPSEKVEQTHYGLNQINYTVSLTQPKLMIENEMYFPGWKAILFLNDKEVQLDAVVVNDVFRAWFLPEGNYHMETFFEFPNYWLLQSVTLTAFVIWIVVITIGWKKLKKNHEYKKHMNV